MVKSRSFIAIPPGATIKELLADRGFSQKEFAFRMNMSEKHISRLINGDVKLTPDVAVRLEMVLGVPAKFWNNLEAIYREKLIKAKEENELEAEQELAKKFPYNEMSKNGWVPETRKASEKVICLRKYFEVVDLGLVTDSHINKIACRRLSQTEKSDLALLAWAQKAKLEARCMETEAVNLKKLEKAMPEIRRMTTKEPKEFCQMLTDKLSDCGIALVLLPHLERSYLHGATFYDGNKIVVGLTVRGRNADIFWFSLFHELGHILLGHVDWVRDITQEDEKEADTFAVNYLIDPKDFHDFVEKNDFSEKSIRAFADSVGIDCGIVVGRLQKENYIPYNRYNEMKTQYSII